ncbi:MAG: hypothetical protein HQL72_08420 [Magnetococcales bacterium]|nr:hypothetical protein [Magnetococcales bacterium]
MEKMKSESVNMKNYHLIHGWIEARFELYLINVESWVATHFSDLSKHPTPFDVDSLNLWVESYLPPKLKREMWEMVQHQQVNGVMQNQFLGGEESRSQPLMGL